MPALFAALVLLLLGAAPQSAKADPYPWCANLSDGFGGARNCYFFTLEQCRATVSGVGGFCEPNPFYDGPPLGQERRAPRRRS